MRAKCPLKILNAFNDFSHAVSAKINPLTNDLYNYEQAAYGVLMQRWKGFVMPFGQLLGPAALVNTCEST